MLPSLPLRGRRVSFVGQVSNLPAGPTPAGYKPAPRRPAQPPAAEPTMRLPFLTLLLASGFALAGLGVTPGAGPKPAPRVTQTDEYVQIDTDALQARVRKKGYVSGVAAGTLLDKKTGARDLGFGLHIMDFLMAPGWRDDDYSRDAKLHGDLPKHYVEGPQICTQAKELKPEVVKGKDFVAVTLRYTFNKPGKGYKAGSTWEQTLVFLPKVRYV